MVDCAYCDHPLLCDACGAPYRPPTPEHYEALSHPDVPVTCVECGEVLVCHWCKAPYDGLSEKDLEADEG
jgi:hypothetical protein